MISAILYFLYSVLLIGWGCLLSPVFFYKAWRRRKYLHGIAQRFGFLEDSLRNDGRPTIWFHACSVGETLSVQPLAHALHERFPRARFVISTVTPTGQSIAIERFARYGQGNAFYFPVDLSFVVKRVLDRIEPAIVIIIDTEIWPNLMREARRRDVPVVLVNGRISARSFRVYRRARVVLRSVLDNYRLLLMKSEEDAYRIRQMGAPAEKVRVSGNIKFDSDMVAGQEAEEKANSLDKALALTSFSGAVIVAGSTHPGEEQTLLEALKHVRRVVGLESTRLLLAPRHPERFASVAVLAERAGYRVARRSHRVAVAEEVEILLLDTLGELAMAYRFATIAFVGGSLVPHGGHSIMEPALYAKPIVVGPSMENFPRIIDEFLARNGILQIKAREFDREAQVGELTSAFIHLLKDPAARDSIGKAAHSVFEGNKGATRFTVNEIAAIYESAPARSASAARS